MSRTRSALTVLLCVLALGVVSPSARAQTAAGAAGFGREVPLAGLSELACQEAFDMAVQGALVRLGYQKADREPPEGVAGLTRSAYLVRREEGRERVLIVGLKTYATQDSRIYVWGYLDGGAGEPESNPDIAEVVAMVEASIKAQQATPRKIPTRDLERETYQLSFMQPEECLAVLKDLGYNTTSPGVEASLSQLPAVFQMKDKVAKSIIGGDAAKAVLNEETTSGEENRLMILYHESQAEEVGRLKDLLEGTVDVAARQVLIEGMVIELNESDLKEMRVNWELWGNDKWTFTALEADNQLPFIISYDPAFSPGALANEIRLKIRAIIEAGKAEVLSSPQVLVLNNRNAQIQVIREVPVFSSIITETTTEVKVTFKTVGIILNIKPRISQDDSTVAMQIMVEVSEAPEEDYVSVAGQNIAPVINRRVVQTIARVQDNTPFIIGGLIRNETARTEDRIPIISRIPILGALFKGRTARREKREVIIVLNPRVIMPGGTNRPVLPKDSAQFDFLDNRLFRNSYRIKADDVFDLRFLENNPKIREAMADAKQYVRRHPGLAAQEPYKSLAAGVIPGEDAVVIRMIYEIVRDNLKLHEQLPTENLILFKKAPDKPAGFSVTWLKAEIERATGQSMDDYLASGYPKKVLFIRYDVSPGERLSKVLETPVADLEWRTVASRNEVDGILAETNRLREDYGYHEFAVAVDNAKELVRLKTAVLVREMVSVNNFEELLHLKNFQVGRRIVVPELEGMDGKMFLVDHYVAEYFYKSDYYYAALKAELERGISILETALMAEEQ